MNKRGRTSLFRQFNGKRGASSVISSRFRSFASRVIRLRCRNFVRELKRERSHVHPGIDPLTLSIAEQQESRRIYPAYLRTIRPMTIRPASLQPNEEFLELQHLVADLSPEDRELCAAAAQRALPKLAARWQVSYRTIKRRWQLVLSRLRQQLELREGEKPSPYREA